jgi:hypothetical protein
MFYVIGTYSDGLNSVLGEYASLALAQRAIRWQGEPRGEINWHNAEKTRAETWYTSGRWPNEKTKWAICKATDSRGIFVPMDGGAPLTVQRGCYTQQAFDATLDRARA